MGTKALGDRESHTVQMLRLRPFAVRHGVREDEKAMTPPNDPATAFAVLRKPGAPHRVEVVYDYLLTGSETRQPIFRTCELRWRADRVIPAAK
nr:hypothetical protein [Streptomyces antimycoticus]